MFNKLKATMLAVLLALLFCTGIAAHAATPVFVDAGNGTIVDTANNLTWLKNANCFGTQLWSAAVSSSANLKSGQCGLTDGSVAGDWHLPTIDELRIFVDSGLRSETLNLAGFSSVDVQSIAVYWSSSINTNVTTSVWYVGMKGGYVGYASKDYSGFFVWPVRSGQFWSLDSLVISTASGGFGPLNIGSPPKSTEVVVQNNDSSSLKKFSASLTGSNAAEVSLAPGGNNPCTSLSPTLAPTTSCTLQVASALLSRGPKSANLTITTAAGSKDVPITATAIATIAGSVTDLATGNKLAAVTVTITGGATTQTDTNGNFLFTTPPANGVYDITISKTGYSSATYSGQIFSDSKSVNLNVRLAPSGVLNFVSTSPLAPASTNVAYNQQIKISGGVWSGGVWPYTFSKAYGTLPPGLVIDPVQGTLSGTPTTAGSYTFAGGVTDKTGVYAEREFTVVVTAPLVITTSATLTRATQNAAYSSAIAASGGSAPYTFAVSTGTLPAGVSLTAATGTLSGTPSATGVSNFTGTVTDSAGRTVSKYFSLTVDAPLTISTTRLSDGIVGSAFNQTLAATGGLAPYTWGVYAGTLPAGLTVAADSGIITGTPTSATSQPVVLYVQDAYGRVTYQQFTANALKPLQILTTAMPNGLANNAYSEQVRLSGGIAPFTYTITGQLPAGLAINSATGIISGTPTATGLTNVQIQVADSSYPTAQTKTQNLAIRITSAVTITTGAVLPNSKRNTGINPITLVAKGGSPGYTWAITDGAFPAGVTLDPATGIITGTPTERGDFTVTIRVTDSVGNATGPATAPPNPDKQFILHVSDILAVTSGAVPNGAKGLPYNALLTASGGLKNYSWAVKTGTLPAGLTLDAASGSISGTPIAKITSNVTFEVTDSDAPAQKAQAALIFEIADTLTIAEKELPKARLNQSYSTIIRPLLGTAPYSWILASGTLPTGITLSQNAGVATLSGTPTAAGTFTIDLTLSDNGTPVQSVTRSYILTVVPEFAITNSGLKAAVRGVAQSDAVTVVGGTLPYTFSVTKGALPSGLTLNSTSGAITGSVTMATGASATFTVTVTDNGDPAASISKEFAIMAIDPLAVSTSVIQGALQKSPYSTTLSTTGGVAPYTWGLATGAVLPQGIAISNAGIISGTPAVCGSFPFTVQVADNTPVATTAQKALTLAVTCEPANGACGSSNAATFAVKPTTNLCTAGTASTITGTGPWSWTCAGTNGGTPATCNADIQTYAIAATVTGGNGTVTCTTPVNAGATSTCTITPANGYQLAIFTDNTTDKKSSVAGSSYSITNVTAAHAIAATFSLIPPAPVNGACGSSNGQDQSAAPTANLCAAGTASVISGTGPWSWTCAGTNGGTNATCAANDTSTPTLSLSTLADGSITNTVTLNISGTVSSNNGVASLKINNAAVTVTSGAFNTPITLQSGANTITTVATDTIGRSTTDSRTITLDTTAPTLTVTTPADNSTTTQGTATITGAVSETSTVAVKVNSGSAQSAALTGNDYSATVNLKSGLNTIDIIATDLAGNTSSIKRSVTYENGIVSLAVTNPNQDTSTTESSITISGTVTDVVSSATVTITADGQSYTPTVAQNGSFSQSIPLPSDKTYAVVVTATDLVGNTGSVQRNIIKTTLLTQPTIADALKVFQAVVGLNQLNASEQLRYDVAPLGSSGAPVGNGVIDAADVILILRRSIGIGSW